MPRPRHRTDHDTVAPAETTPIPLPPAPPGAHDHLSLAAHPDIVDADSAQPEQPGPYPDTAHAVSAPPSSGREEARTPDRAPHAPFLSPSPDPLRNVSSVPLTIAAVMRQFALLRRLTNDGHLRCHSLSTVSGAVSRKVAVLRRLAVRAHNVAEAARRLTVSPSPPQKSGTGFGPTAGCRGVDDLRRKLYRLSAVEL